MLRWVMRLCLSFHLLLVPAALGLFLTGCERSTGFCQTQADCSGGLQCSVAINTCQPAAPPDMAPPVVTPPAPHLGARVQNPAGSVAGDYFGYAVAATSSYAVFGAHLANKTLGAVYVAELTGTTCGVPVALAPQDTPAVGDYLGISVAASGNTVAVGAYNKGSGAGAVYIYTRMVSAGTVTWSGPTKLTAPDTAANDLFGSSVSLSGDTLAVGAYNKGGTVGAAYGFSRVPGTTTWLAGVRLPSPTDAAPAAFDYFGLQVAASASYIAVGAPGRQNNHGAVYLYKYDATNKGVQVTNFLVNGTTPNEQLGGALSLSTNILAVGSGGYSPGSGVVGQGQVLLYDLETFTALPSLAISSAIPRQRFGGAVALAPVAAGAAETLLVGAPGRDQTFGQPYSAATSASGLAHRPPCWTSGPD